ncbi:hypothetical protein EDD18DRAFT_1106848 [Armillaria luteobubalina]|uniref:F-box domain-containing protein n=1 Tax=Armillaria luteobubalina TaxID=153913 RepID=A0AA39Q2G2_9AGAR|nr:hypothetical protein EDD18DRAFT_1106848 [Armillaria luteobubalina]
MAPSHQSRRTATKRTYKDTESEPEDGHNKDYASEALVKKKPRVKKVKQDAGNTINAAPKHRRLRGLLQKIFSKLDPLDLLRLSRTTKDLRALLLQRSSTFIWKRARQNVKGLPPLPEDLSEPKYAHLAFDKYCDSHITGRSVCATHHMSSGSRGPNFAENVLRGLRFIPGGHPILLYTFVPPMISRLRQAIVAGNYHYYVPAITALLEESESFSDEMQDAWVLRKRDAFKELQIHARLCDDWSDSRVEDRFNELKDIRAQRLEQHLRVVERLTTLGWGEELENQRLIDELTWHKLVRPSQPRLLTERAWSTMSDAVISIVKQHRNSRLASVLETRMDDFRAAYYAATRDFPLLPIYPKAVDVAVLEPFSNLLFTTPLDQDVTESVTATLAKLPIVAGKWRETENCALQALMLKAGLEPNLDLATSFFKCNLCRGLCQYPYVLAHRCFSLYPYNLFDPDNWKGNAVSRLWDCDEAPIWSASQYEVDGEAFKRVQSIVQACGLNPETATCEDMDSLNCRVTCSNSETGSLVMRWQIAAQCHDQQPNSQAWKLLDDAGELERVKDLEKLAKITGYRDSSYGQKFICSHCKFLRRKGYDMKQHLLEAHSVDRISADDFDWPVDRPSTSIKDKGVYLYTRVETDTTEEATSRTYFIH